MKILVLDTGISLEHALRLGRDRNKVYYYTPWQLAFPKFKDYATGLGFTEIEKVMFWADWIDKVNLICSFDIGFGDIISFLRKKGYTCFGAGEGEKLEWFRFNTRKLQKSVGLPVQPTFLTKGVSALRDFIARNPDVYVKFDIFRGDLETFYAKDYKKVELLLDELESAFGPFKESYEFMIEKDIGRGLEPGFDLFFSKTDYIKPYLYGFEISKSAYIGQYTLELPSPLNETASKLATLLRKLDYRGPISTEEIVIDENKHYLLDICGRYPYPLSAIYTESILNYTEVIYGVAQGKQVKLKPIARFVGCLPITSEHAADYWLAMDFPPELRKKIKLQSAGKVGSNYFAVKGNETIAVAISWGDSVNEVIEDLLKTAEKFEAYDAEPAIASLLEAPKVLEKAKKMKLWRD